jgi:hypothetical protein
MKKIANYIKDSIPKNTLAKCQYNNKKSKISQKYQISPSHPISSTYPPYIPYLPPLYLLY